MSVATLPAALPAALPVVDIAPMLGGTDPDARARVAE